MRLQRSCPHLVARHHTSCSKLVVPKLQTLRCIAVSLARLPLRLCKVEFGACREPSKRHWALVGAVKIAGIGEALYLRMGIAARQSKKSRFQQPKIAITGGISGAEIVEGVLTPERPFLSAIGAHNPIPKSTSTSRYRKRYHSSFACPPSQSGYHG